MSSADAKAVGRLEKEAVRELTQAVELPTLKKLGLDLDELLAVVPDEVVMQCEMAAKIGIIASPPARHKELIAEIIQAAWEEN